MKRNFGLDIVRAFAILVVVEQHGRGIIGQVFPGIHRLGMTDGVDIFFVLSGFLIGGILLGCFCREKVFDISGLFNFLARRWLRTLPNYYLALGVNLTVALITRNLAGFSPAYLCFLQNLWSPFTDHRFFSESWSLSVEEWFYLLFPLALLVYALFKRRASKETFFFFSTIVLICAITALRWLRYAHLGGLADIAEWNTHFRCVVALRIDSIAIGVLGAFIARRFPLLWESRVFRRITLAAGVVMVIALDRTSVIAGRLKDPFFICVPYFPLYSIAVLLLFPALCSLKERPSSLCGMLIETISTISYSMYLCHNSLIGQPLARLVSGKPAAAVIAAYILYWCAVFLVSYLVYRLYEKPFLRWRDRNVPLGGK
jgi:peptidoglycan/LPS O-acetylase OafA/YrhL